MKTKVKRSAPRQGVETQQMADADKDADAELDEYEAPTLSQV